MEVNLKERYSFDQIFEELFGEKAENIMVSKANDKFFVGYGCETSYAPELPSDLSSNKHFLKRSYQNSLNNISICNLDPKQSI